VLDWLYTAIHNVFYKIFVDRGLDMLLFTVVFVVNFIGDAVASDICSGW
jgi:hypothetical protein